MTKVTRQIALMLMILIISIGGVQAEEEKSELDVSKIGVGAMVQGRGGWYAGPSEGPDAALLNPAGLGAIRVVKATSMYTSLLSEYDYILASGIIPLGSFGTMGLSYTGVLTDAGYSRDANDVIGDSMDYADNNISLTWGMPVFSDNMFAGLRAKYYQKGWSGDVTDNANATGYGVDLGYYYKVNNWATLGLVWENVFSQITWETDLETSVPSNVRAGGAIDLIAPNGLMQMGKQELIIGADIDYSMGDEGVALGHAGIEYWPIEYLALRAGADQVPYLDETETDLTLGVGLKYASIQFDYAYHPYANLTDNDSHFFSLSYNPKQVDDAKGPVVNPPAGKPPAENFVELKNPKDRTITLEKEAVFEGQVVDNSVAVVYINEEEIYIDENGNFRVEVPLKVGKNYNRIESKDKYGNTLGVEDIRQLRLITFNDVNGSWAELQIQQLATLGLVNGYPDGNFSPEGKINRAEVATLLAKARNIPTTGAKQLFSDLPASHWAFEYVYGCYTKGLVKGYPDGTYLPKKNITRAEGVMLIVRFDGVNIPATTNRKVYEDIPATHWVAPAVAIAKENGYLRYIRSSVFEDKKMLSRAETVEILSRTNWVQKKLDDLYDWESYQYGTHTVTLEEKPFEAPEQNSKNKQMTKSDAPSYDADASESSNTVDNMGLSPFNSEVEIEVGPDPVIEKLYVKVFAPAEAKITRATAIVEDNGDQFELKKIDSMTWQGTYDISGRLSDAGDHAVIVQLESESGDIDELIDYFITE